MSLTLIKASNMERPVNVVDTYFLFDHVCSCSHVLKLFYVVLHTIELRTHGHASAKVTWNFYMLRPYPPHV